MHLMEHGEAEWTVRWTEMDEAAAFGKDGGPFGREGGGVVWGEVVVGAVFGCH